MTNISQLSASKMKQGYFRPRLPMILALSIVILVPIPTETFQFGPNYAHPLRSSYRSSNAVQSKAEPEDVRVQRKRSDGPTKAHHVGARGVDGSFLAIKEAPAKLVEAREHGSTTLECSAAGSPAPSLAWYKNGQPVIKVPEIVFYPGHGTNQIGEVSQGQDKSLGVATAKLELECISEEDAGFYECVASQGQKTETVATEVHVVSFGAGNCQPKSMTSAPPKITQFYQTYMMEMGFDAHLRCVTVGRHSTMWIGPDEETITEGTNKYKIMPDGSLVIHDLDFNDMGVYVCVAKNQFGHDMAETFVYPVAPMY